VTDSRAPAIRLRHVSHRFGPLAAVDDVSFDVAHGEIFGFIGPNGAGKTTTIRILSTLLEPMEGKVEIDGVDAVVDPAAVRRLIGYMPDHAGVYERVTVREYLQFFAAAAGVKSPSAVDAAIELTRLGELEERLVATMSKGMRQRLGLSRVLLHDPKVLILDEPASDLDPRARIEMRDLLIELRDLGKTILLSSHILSELDDICTSVGILERGKLIAKGPIGAIAPASTGGPASTRPSGAPASARKARARVRIRVLGDAAAVLPQVREHPGVLDASGAAGGWLSVSHGGGDAFVAELVRSLVTSGAAVIGVEPERAELERVFMEVTKGRSS
jgi:ABC-2 type transport system ATP-binding protein